MTCYSDVCSRWVDVALGSDSRLLRTPRVFPNGDQIYSYGSHFEMARFVRNKAGDPIHVLVNGDNFSVSTTRHQSHVRNAVARSGLPIIIVPFSVLDAAGIDRDTVRPVDVLGDRFDVTEHVAYEQPLGSVWTRIDEYAYVDLTQAEIDAKLDEKHAKDVEVWTDRHEWAAEGSKFWTDWAGRLENSIPPERPTELSDWESRERRVVGFHVVLRASATSWREIDVEALDDGRVQFSWQTSRHWLGESLLQGTIPERRFTTCKPCKGTGVDPEFHGPPEPEERWDWEGNDRVRVVRPGRRARTYDGPRCPKCKGGGGRHWTKRRTALFLSGFDHQESRPSYFFCELPKGSNPTTVAEAYEVLKPDTVRLAEQMGRQVVRQGDIFAVELQGANKRALRRAGARFEKRGNLLGTNHEATEVAYLKDGTTLARGVLTHAPQWRDPDHRRQKMGRAWHVIVKNTVPLAA